MIKNVELRMCLNDRVTDKYVQIPAMESHWGKVKHTKMVIAEP